MFCFLDNHDTAADDGEDRFDRKLPVEAGNAAFVATFLRRGIPLLFNGNEIADNARSSFFAADLAGKGVAFRTDFAPVSGAAPFPAEGGGLDAGGVCRLDPHGYVVAEVRNA